MIALGHIAEMPVEELLPWLIGPGSGLLATRAWISVRAHRHRDRDR